MFSFAIVGLSQLQRDLSIRSELRKRCFSMVGTDLGSCAVFALSFAVAS